MDVYWKIKYCINKLKCILLFSNIFSLYNWTLDHHLCTWTFRRINEIFFHRFYLKYNRKIRYYRFDKFKITTSPHRWYSARHTHFILLVELWYKQDKNHFYKHRTPWTKRTTNTRCHLYKNKKHYHPSCGILLEEMNMND